MQQFLDRRLSEVAPSAGAASARLPPPWASTTEDAGRAALVATEIGTNLVKHGGGGEIIARKITSGTSKGLELLGLDKGPGMADVTSACATAIPPAAVPAMGSARWNACRSTLKFTRVLVRARRCWRRCGRTRSDPKPERLEIGALVIPKPGETECGDAWCYAERPESVLVLGIDGLGHGFGAAQAANEACRVFDNEKHRPPLAHHADPARSAAPDSRRRRHVVGNGLGRRPRDQRCCRQCDGRARSTAPKSNASPPTTASSAM